MDFKQVFEGLKAPFPKEAYSVDSSRGFNLTSLKAQYAVERLNEVLGITGWNLEGEFKDTDKGVLYIGKLSLVENGESIHSVEAIGYSDKKKNTGDTFKSARTDALSKAASYYGLGNEMFKGNVEVPKKQSTGASSFKKKETKSVESKKEETLDQKPRPNFRKKAAKKTSGDL